MRSNAGLATAAICAIQKWGLRYIDEWVDYHLAIGFETIFIYDNSDDFETLETVPGHVSGLTVNWQLFGWNNQTKYEAKPLSLRFNLFEKNKVVKTIARTDRVSSMPNPHWAQYTEKKYMSYDTNAEIVEGPFNNRMPTDVLALNHYRNKSLEEYTDRCERGRADNEALQAKDVYTPCQPEKVILAEWENDNIEQSEFDDSVWKLLKERVPAYTKYENR
eukprot:scaffold128_cov140-Skeletonema_menzelii.AAC.18